MKPFDHIQVFVEFAGRQYFTQEIRRKLIAPLVGRDALAQ